MWDACRKKDIDSARVNSTAGRGSGSNSKPQRPERVIARIVDADSRGSRDQSGLYFLSSLDEKLLTIERKSIALAIDGECFAEFSWSVCEIFVFADSSAAPDEVESFKGFNGADENGFWFFLATSDDIEAVVKSVDQINVCVAAGQVHRTRTISSAITESVTRTIFDS